MSKNSIQEKICKIIRTKSKGYVLCASEIRDFVQYVSWSTSQKTRENVDRSQIGAMLMAIYLNGLTEEELSILLKEMMTSGHVFKWPMDYMVVDKHSTGGVGDKTSLVLAPCLVAVGLKVPMISGRSLDHTGGTLNKLESIPGFRSDLTVHDIHKMVDTVGCCIAAQTDEIVPADKVLYECRELTNTVACPPLITASIVSKKLSVSPQALIYDVKYGKGSFFASKEDAIITAKTLIDHSKSAKATALLTSMEAPLGKTIGNSLEVLEAIACLQGQGSRDIIQLVKALGSELLHAVKGIPREEGEKIIEATLDSCGNKPALRIFKHMLVGQGVENDIADSLCNDSVCAMKSAILPRASNVTDVQYEGKRGYIKELNPLILANIWKTELHKSGNNPGVGLHLLKTIGDKIEKGEVWVRMHHEHEITPTTKTEFRNAIVVSEIKKEDILIDERISKSPDGSFRREPIKHMRDKS